MQNLGLPAHLFDFHSDNPSGSRPPDRECQARVTSEAPTLSPIEANLLNLPKIFCDHWNPCELLPQLLIEFTSG